MGIVAATAHPRRPRRALRNPTITAWESTTWAAAAPVVVTARLNAHSEMETR